MLESAAITLGNFKIDNLNLKLDNEVCFLFGSNGSGKTSILNCISGLLPVTSGLVKKPQSIFYLPANPILDMNLEAWDIFDILGCDNDLVSDLSLEFEIKNIKHQLISNISSGEYKRLWIVATLSYKAKYYLLDEPLVYLDQRFQYILQDCIKQLRSKNRFLIVTHNFNWCLGFSDASAVVVDSTLSKKEHLIEVLQGDSFRKAFKLSTKLSDSPTGEGLILTTSRL